MTLANWLMRPASGASSASTSFLSRWSALGMDRMAAGEGERGVDSRTREGRWRHPKHEAPQEGHLNALRRRGRERSAGTGPLTAVFCTVSLNGRLFR